MNKSASSRRVGIWIRVSTDMQAQGDSPETHERRARDYATSKGWKVIETYRLSGVSGAVSLDHSEGHRMMDDIERGHITALIASKFARIARDGIQFRLLHRKFKAVNADIISLDENIDTSTPAGELILGIIADLAEWERKEIGSRIRASIKPRAIAGKPMGGVGPFGYHWVDRKLVVNPKEAPIRKLIHELYIKHRRMRTVARLLNEMGHKTRKGKVWTGGGVEWLICDPSAKGLYRRNFMKCDNYSSHWVYKPESEVVYVPVEPIVTPEVWDKAYSILMDSRAANQRPSKRTRHLLSGLVVCECGRKMYGRDDSPQFLCKKGKNCRNKVPIAAVEQMLDEVMQKRLSDNNVAASFCASSKTHLKTCRNRLSKINRDQAKAKKTIQKAFDMVTNGRMTDSRYQVICEPQEALLLRTKKEQSNLESEIRFLEEHPVASKGYLSDTRRRAAEWKQLSVENKRATLESNQLKITVNNSKKITFSLVYHPLWETMAKEQRTTVPTIGAMMLNSICDFVHV